MAMGKLLKDARIDYCIIGAEKNIGDTWRLRYDSLRLFTPRWLNQLPCGRLPVKLDPNGYPDKNEIADYLENYAFVHELVMQLNTCVVDLRRNKKGFLLKTTDGQWQARTVVLATGPFQKPSRPAFADRLSDTVTQLHTAQYQNSKQLQPGNVVIVGAGNSGAQIAVELCEQGTHELALSAGGSLAFMPQSLLGKSIFWWFRRLGVYRAHINTAIGWRLSQRPDPIIGKSLKKYINSGTVTLHPRCVGADSNALLFADGTRLTVNNVIWATGFKPDYPWLNIPDVLTPEGRPSHQRGQTAVPGLYFLGLPWQYSRKSALIGGVGDDARYLLSLLQQNLAAS